MNDEPRVPAPMLTLAADPSLAEYGFGDSHPFGNDRLEAFWREAIRRGLHRRVHRAGARLASREELLCFHDGAFLDRMASLSEIGFGYLDHGDTPARKGIFQAASRVTGTLLDAIDVALHGDTPRAFLPIAGLHHGQRDAAAGFCVLNDCGVVIETLKQRHGLRRIAYVDIDAHHGDGVFYAFEDDPAVIIADIHEDGRYLYPGTGHADERGRGDADGTKHNVPMLPGSDDDDFFAAWPALLEHLDAFRPELVLLQAGADSIRGDPLTHLAFTPAAHRHAATTLRQLAERHADGRMLVMGGGGYHRGNIANTWCEVVEALL